MKRFVDLRFLALWGLTALARAMGYADGPAFLGRLRREMEKTRACFRTYLGPFEAPG